MMSKDPHSVGDILDRLEELGEGGGRVKLGDMVEAFGHRSYGPFLIVPALIELSPIGTIPGVPTALAAIVVLFSIQMLMNREHLWLPGFLERRSIGGGKLAKAADKLRPVADRMDRWFHGRLPVLTTKPFIRVAAIGCILLALTVPPLELIPFASSAPMLAIAAFGLALLVRDGALMVAACAIAVAAVGLGVVLFVGR